MLIQNVNIIKVESDIICVSVDFITFKLLKKPHYN
jgi:hypothetical protein